MENGDAWLAPDKLHHLLACFFITLSVSFLLSRSRYSFLRRWAAPLAALASLSAGETKEAADEIGFFESAGASLKDAASDAVGVLVAIPFVTCIKRFAISKAADDRNRDRVLSMV